MREERARIRPGRAGRSAMEVLWSRLGWLMGGVLALVACGGDGCSGGCEGACNAPYPQNAPSVENGAQVRLSAHGLAFLEQQAEPLVVELLGGAPTFCVPQGQDPDVCYARSCPSTGETGCELSVTIDDVQIEAVAPNKLQASIVIGGLNHETDFVEIDLATAVECVVRLGTQNDAGIPARLTATFTTDPVSGDVSLDLNPEDIQIEFSQLDIDIDGVGFIDIFACEGLDFVASLSFLQDLIFGAITGPLSDQITALTSGLLCRQCASDVDCPQDTDCVDDPNNEGERYCYDAQAERCVAAPLGLEGLVDLGALLEGTIPGIKAELAYQLKASGYAEAQDEGLSLGMRGGTYADKAACVPLVPPPTALSAPRSPLLSGNTGPDGEPFHLGLGLSKAFLDEALWGLYNSGVLCLSVGTGLSDLLSTATFSTLLPSLRELTGGANGPFYLQLSPSRPPTATIGAGTIDPVSGDLIDPLLTLNWSDLSVDFYAFVDERFVRVLTIQADLALPLGINPTEEGLLIVLGDLQQAFGNLRIKNNELLTEDEAFLQSILPSLINIALPLLGESLFSPIEVPEFQGFTIDLENTALEGIEDNTMIGLFANLARAPEGTQNAVAARLDTAVALVALDLPSPSLVTPGPRAHEAARAADLVLARPVLAARAEASLLGGPVEADQVEFSHRLDGGLWSSFRADPEIVLDDPILLLQGRHRLEVRARRKNALATLDRSPAALEFDVDFEAPHLDLIALDRGALRPVGRDAGTAAEDLRYRARLDDGPWGPWSALDALALPQDATGLLEVQVRDLAGHTASATHALRPAALELAPAAAPSGGCACATAPRGAGQGALAAAALLLGAALLLRRRAAALALLALLGSGCEDDKPAAVQACAGGCPAGQRCLDGACSLGCNTAADCVPGDACVENACVAPNACEDASDCPPGQGCVEELGRTVCGVVTCDDDGDCADLACAPTRGVCGNNGVCQCEAPCVAGCPEGQYCCNEQNNCQALPDPCASMACDPGFRPEVGAPAVGDPATCSASGGVCDCVELDPLWEGSIGRYLAATQTEGAVFLSAYNDRYGDLMLGVLDQGGRARWQFVDGVPANGTVTGSLNGPRGGVATRGPDVGRFTSIAADAQGRLHVAYRSDEDKSLRYGLAVYDGDTFRFTAHEVDAEGDAGLWAQLSLGPDGAPAIAYMAAAVPGEGSRLRWAQASGAEPASAADWTFTNIDRAPLPAEPPPAYQDLPPGVGPFVRVARFSDGAPAVVYYDRLGTDLRYSRWQDGAWTAPLILDGRDADGNDTGDMGRFADIAIDADDKVHVAYVDQVAAQLRYINLSEQTSQLVDDGVRVVPNAVSINRVGDGARLLIGADGQPQILYQDATQHQLLLARRDDAGAWTVLTVAGAEEPYKGSYGFYNAALLRDGRALFLTFRYNRTVEPPDNGVSAYTF